MNHLILTQCYHISRQKSDLEPNKKLFFLIFFNLLLFLLCNLLINRYILSIQHQVSVVKECTSNVIDQPESTTIFHQTYQDTFFFENEAWWIPYQSTNVRRRFYAVYIILYILKQSSFYSIITVFTKQIKLATSDPRK